MQELMQIVDSLGLSTSTESHVVVCDKSQMAFENPAKLHIEIGEHAVADIFILHSEVKKCEVYIDIAEHAKCNLVELYTVESEVVMHINQAMGALSTSVTVGLNSLTSNYDISLNGIGAHAEINTLQLAGLDEKSLLKINMRHLTTDSSSYSLSKCVASGRASVEFGGLVYVAQDAQRTSAEQNTRSLFLSDTAYIKAEPQLEIFADDVKCTHGATVGQIDSDAILYMRQRGLSQEQARRVQMEGFIRDIVERSPIEGLAEPIMNIVNDKLHQM